jgi:hypothetical protein
MANVPTIRRLLLEDFPDQAEWIAKLISPINTQMEQIVAALNKQLTIEQNMAGSIRTVELDGTFPVKIAWTGSRPVSVLVGNVYRSDGTSFTLTDAVQVQWQFNQSGQLQIDTVTGITPSTSAKYKLVLECKAG